MCMPALRKWFGIDNNVLLELAFSPPLFTLTRIKCVCFQLVRCHSESHVLCSWERIDSILRYWFSVFWMNFEFSSHCVCFLHLVDIGRPNSRIAGKHYRRTTSLSFVIRNIELIRLFEEVFNKNVSICMSVCVLCGGFTKDMGGCTPLHLINGGLHHHNPLPTHCQVNMCCIF